MSLLVVVLLISAVSKNIVNAIKMLTIPAKRLGAVWLLLSGVLGGLIVWALDFKINIFSFMDVVTTTRISIVSGFLIGLMGQDIYKIMKLIQRKTPVAKA